MADKKTKPEPVHGILKPAESELKMPTRLSLEPHVSGGPTKSPAADPKTQKAPKPKKRLHHSYYEDKDEEDSDEEQVDSKLQDEYKHKEKQANIIVHEKHPNLASVLTYHEEVAYGKERHFANNLDDAFSPCRILMVSLFRFPLQLTVKRDFSREFSYSWKSFRGWMFFITAWLIGINAFLISLSLGVIMLDFPHQPEKGYTTHWSKKEGVVLRTQQKLRIEELFLLQRNFVPMVLLLLSLAHICTGDVSLFFKRAFISKYFTFWDEAVEIMKMDVAKYPSSVKQYMVRITMFYLGYLILFVGLCAGRIAPVATGAPTQLVILWARPFHPPIHAWNHLRYLRYVGIAVYIYLLMCSKVYILLFLYKCKILHNAYATWNERLETVIHKGKKDKKSRLEHCQKRTGFDHLFRDYVVLLDLLRGADTMFANIIESYFATQMFSLCFEIYYFKRTFTEKLEFQGARQLDGIIIGIYLTHSIIMLVLATNASAQVGEVAMEGLEIIRRSGCLGRKSNDEMYFTLSLYMSYTGHFQTELQGGKFVIFDRSFIVALAGAIFTYYIILSQFTPPLAMLDPNKLDVFKAGNNLKLEESVAILIRHVESTHQFGNKFKVGYDTFRNSSI